MTTFEVEIFLDDETLLPTLSDAFPELEVEFRSGFGFLEALGTIIIPSAALALNVIQFLSTHRKTKRKEKLINNITYQRGDKFVKISADGVDEASLIARIKAIGDVSNP